MANFSYSPPTTIISPIKQLLLITVGASLLAPLLEGFFRSFLGIPGPQTLGLLSSYGAKHFWFWQPLTHLFIHGLPGMGITFGLLIEIAFHCYILWALGSSLLDRLTPRSFLGFYLGSGIAAGILAGVLMLFSSTSYFLGGSTPAILAILSLWTMLYPEARLLLFLVFPISSQWILGGTAAMITLIHLSQGDLIGWSWMITGLLSGYLFGALLGYRSPFPQTHLFDQKIHTIWKQLLQQWNVTESGKIFDIKTGRPIINDEKVIDAILEKISKKGRHSLTLRERWILYRGSRKRRK